MECLFTSNSDGRGHISQTEPENRYYISVVLVKRYRHGFTYHIIL